MESELLLQKQVSSLKERVAELESFIGLVDGQPVNSDDKGGKEALLAEQLRKECEKVKELALKVELGEKVNKEQCLSSVAFY